MAENFFGILKSECLRRHKPKTIEQAKLLIDNFIYFYNHERIQLKTKLTPLEKRRQFAELLALLRPGLLFVSYRWGSVQIGRIFSACMARTFTVWNSRVRRGA